KTDEPRGFPRKSVWNRVSEWIKKTKDIVVLYARRIGRFCYGIACKVARLLWTTAQCLWAVVRAMFWPSVESKPLPRSAPKPFKPLAQDSPSFNKVEFNPEESLVKQEVQPDQGVIPSAAPEPEPLTRRGHPTPAERVQMYAADTVTQQHNGIPVAMPRHTSSYIPDSQLHHEDFPGPSTHRFTDTSLDGAHMEISPSVGEIPMHAPPPAPPPPPLRPVRIDTVNGREDTTVDPWEYTPQQPITTKKEPPGIGKLPADVMAELHGTQKMRLEREASVQREMTQSCHPDMTQWKTQENESRYDRSATATPYRASSVGPTMRKLEQVVSRLDDASENEAQYVFRAKAVRITGMRATSCSHRWKKLNECETLSTASFTLEIGSLKEAVRSLGASTPPALLQNAVKLEARDACAQRRKWTDYALRTGLLRFTQLQKVSLVLLLSAGGM
ncbi:hypothetical protein OSTOST_04100, partial [Ostertagia ostertagi]